MAWTWIEIVLWLLDLILQRDRSAERNPCSTPLCMYCRYVQAEIPQQSDGLEYRLDLRSLNFLFNPSETPCEAHLEAGYRTFQAVVSSARTREFQFLQTSNLSEGGYT